MPSSSAKWRVAPSESDRDEIEQKKPSRRERLPRDSDLARSRDDSRGREKSKAPSAGSSSCWQRGLLLVLFFCGPVGTVISFLLLPKEADTTESLSHHSPMGTGTTTGGRTRMVHLSLANTDRRARFVLDENTGWETFLAGCRERLQVKNIRRVTDSSGEAILAVEDLVHDDHIVIYATPTASDGAPALPSADDLGPTLPLPLQALSAAAVTKSRFLQSIDTPGGGDPLERDPLYDHENPSRPCGKRHPTFRLAMLIPWVNDLPPWLSYFAATAQRSEYLVDWLIFHETLVPPRQLPSNVKFIDLGAGGLSQLIGLKMGEELGMPVRNASLLIRSMRFMLDKWPRLVAEYKPAFGSIFEQYLGSEYTHWGYCDLDMVIGNLPLFLEHSELATQDIVSYSFGDMDALYLRGQWTIHRNRRDISTIWKRCPHLGDELQKELLMKVAWVRRMESRGIKNYPKRFQSAEGCYSHRATQLPGIRIKVAHKQFVGLSVPSDDVIFAVNGAVWQCPKVAHVDVASLRKHSTQPCSEDLPGVQEPLGELLPLEVTPDGGCGKWMPVEYRMCALNLPEPPERERDTIGFNTYLKDGKFYAQRFRSTMPVLDNGCRQGSFFHMQEWKKIWGYGTHGVDPLELVFTKDKAPTFTVTTEGISLLT